LREARMGKKASFQLTQTERKKVGKRYPITTTLKRWENTELGRKGTLLQFGGGGT